MLCKTGVEIKRRSVASEHHECARLSRGQLSPGIVTVYVCRADPRGERVPTGARLAGLARGRGASRGAAQADGAQQALLALLLGGVRAGAREPGASRHRRRAPL